MELNHNLHLVYLWQIIHGHKLWVSPPWKQRQSELLLCFLDSQSRTEGMLHRILDPGLKMQSLGTVAIESANFHVDTLNTMKERWPEESPRQNGGRRGLCLAWSPQCSCQHTRHVSEALLHPPDKLPAKYNPPHTLWPTWNRIAQMKILPIFFAHKSNTETMIAVSHQVLGYFYSKVITKYHHPSHG